MFGASVWGTSQATSSTYKEVEEDSFDTEHDTPDDFDDFGPTADSSAAADDDDDDFGDFGDFGEAGQTASSSGFQDEFQQLEMGVDTGGFGAAGSVPLQLDPFPSRDDLVAQVEAILLPITQRLPDTASNEGIRDVEGMSQILAVRDSRDLFNEITQPPPPSKPPNWTRSRIRRQHLITLGVPVNLDEVLEPQAPGKSALPPLHITSRPMSAPPGPRKQPHTNGNMASSVANSRSGTPQPGGRRAASNLGPKPVLDEARISKLVEVDPANLSLLPLPALEKHLGEIREQTASASALLTYLLQSRDALQQDSETYNGLIAELVGEAQKIKTGKGRVVTRKGTIS